MGDFSAAVCIKLPMLFVIFTYKSPCNISKRRKLKANYKKFIKSIALFNEI